MVTRATAARPASWARPMRPAAALPNANMQGQVNAFNPDRTLTYGGYSVLCTATDGTIDPSRVGEGLYDFDTRVLSSWRLSVDDREPEYVASGSIDSDRWW